ncbi:tyrosine-protein phosphatase non-receptor type 2 isoform X2 [Acipenser ruthenus]|uniref:tyrosine-protein phosphatase non-receptor type 2 isoform X2 n=1 Tax=Acipenser ruthenus TaxID=7906 RepID=UPI002740D917|nr:tyrosine-protein phosphatase non-receptor type 2 isoform X2 [Acipenser ruthenus]
MDQEFKDMDSVGQWSSLYMEIRSQSQDCPYKVAKFPENQNRNRYRDVSPFDHSRVKLQNAENDYINASLVVMEEAQRSYILTQGPLRNTCDHFWLMIWEQKSRAVIMLNRVIEKGSEKCAQYWPTSKDHEMIFSDTGFHVTLLSEDVKSYYTVRVLGLENMSTGETREIYHFHYTTWPDFGVPESPASFLNFLFKVRETGCLSSEHGPAVVHCSAGIGRSGTFSLVDTCILLMDKRKDHSFVNIKKILLDMRKYRMGLIQTPDQLRFSYMAVTEGAKYIMGDSSVQAQPIATTPALTRERRSACHQPTAAFQSAGQPRATASEDNAVLGTLQKQWKELSKEDQEPVSYSAPSQPPKHTTEKFNGNSMPHLEEDDPEVKRMTTTHISSKVQDNDGNIGSVRKRRHREDRISSTAQKVLQMKQKLSEAERKRKRPRMTDT